MATMVATSTPTPKDHIVLACNRHLRVSLSGFNDVALSSGEIV
ncbi:unnamed protein product [Acidithrix sp. C25]|nr:unnamed protein product [Acidithrix sp. C25]